jgi:hypothetical protein
MIDHLGIRVADVDASLEFHLTGSPRSGSA